MYEITLDNAVFDIHNDCMLALHWYAQLNDTNRQKYVDSIGIHRAQYIHQFTLDAMWYVSEYDANGFDVFALSDLSQRIRRKVNAHDESLRCNERE